MIARRDKVYKIPELPSIKFYRFIADNNISGHTGSIFKRRVKNTINIYFHYAFFYGIDEHGVTWVIENNLDGIECVTLRDFMQDSTGFEFEFLNKDVALFQTVMSRAAERMHIPYNARTNNCEHFVNYCLFGRIESFQATRTEGVADAFLSTVELYASLNPYSSGIVDLYAEFRAKINLPRSKFIHDGLEKIRIHHAVGNINEFEKAIKKYPSVTSITRKNKTTYFHRAKRFAIIDFEANCLMLKLNEEKCKRIASKKAVTYPSDVVKGKGWVAIQIERSTRQLCLGLIDESFLGLTSC